MINLTDISTFLLFSILQAWFINGLFIAMSGKTIPDSNGKMIDMGELLYPISKMLRKSRYSFVRKSIGLECVKCGSSFWGLVTFIPAFGDKIGYGWEMLPVALFDIVILIYLNYFFYKL